MKLSRWNYETHSYDLVDVPNEWKCSTYEDDMSKVINCPHCGGEFKVGDGYTSMEFHTGLGFGFIVCEECYKEEWERRKRYSEREE